MGIILSSDEVVDLVTLETENNLNGILTKTRAIPCCQGNSYLGLALEHAAKIAEQRLTKSPLHVVILTDGIG